MAISKPRVKRCCIITLQEAQVVLACFLLLSMWIFSSGTAHADGGAPNLAYVAGTSTGISVIDIARQRISKTIALAGSPRTVLLSFDGSLLYTTQPARGLLTVIEAATGKIHCSVHVAGQPSALALSPLEDALYVAGLADSHIRVFDPKTCALEHVWQASGPISALAISYLGGAFPAHKGVYQLWAATTDQLLVFDPDGTRLASFSVPAGPQFLCIPPGFLVYVTTRQGTVMVVDLATRAVMPLGLGDGPLGSMDYDATTGEVYVPEEAQHQLVVLAPVATGTREQPGKIARILHLDGVPQAVAITSDGQLGFVALQDGRVAMLDVPARQVVMTFAVGGNPHFVITGLYPPAVSLTASQQPVQKASPPWRSPLFLGFVALFVFVLIMLLGLLVLWWRKRPVARKR